MQAIGDVDEANSAIGLAIVSIGSGAPGGRLRAIQNDLFDLGADIATPDMAMSGALRITARQVERLEAEIDALNENLSSLDSFVLPGGSPAAAAIHLARAVTRRAERSATAAAEATSVSPMALAYLNRLSDYLFVLARHANRDGADDVKWVPGAAR